MMAVHGIGGDKLGTEFTLTPSIRGVSECTEHSTLALEVWASLGIQSSGEVRCYQQTERLGINHLNSVDLLSMRCK